MFCPSCGAKMELQGTFCSSCGNPINEEVLDNSQVTYPNEKQHANTPTKNVTLFIVLGWVFFAISLILIPVIFGAGAFIMGYLLRKNGSETHGTILMIMAIAGAILGALLGAAAAGY